MQERVFMLCMPEVWHLKRLKALIVWNKRDLKRLG